MNNSILSENRYFFKLNDKILTVNIFLLEDGEPWFIAKEISDILKYSETNKMLRRLDDDEKKTIARNGSPISIEFFGNQGSIIIINESGLYNAIFGSHLAVAKTFKKWVTREVLPSIRKTGTYSISQQTPETAHQTVQTQNENLDLDFYSQEIEKMAKLVEFLNSKNTKTLYYLDNLSKSLNIKSPLELLKIDLSSYYFIPTELGNFINTTAVETNKILEAHGFQIRENGVWHRSSKWLVFANKMEN